MGWSQSAYLETAGKVVIEAENFALSHAGVESASAQTWQVTTVAGSSGGCVQALPNSGTSTDESLIGPRLDYQIKFSTSGTYFVWARLLGASGSDNSIHTGLNSSPATLGSSGISTGSTYNTWVWKKTKADGSAVTVSVGSVGYATFNLWMRQDGVVVDRILLTTDPTYTPNGMDSAESARENGGNQFPSVELTAPSIGANYTLPSTISFAATASDQDAAGSIAKVEFFEGITKLGEDLTSPYNYSWGTSGTFAPGTYTLSARATDNLGATTATPLRSLRLLPGLPYLAGFEILEGFAAGSLQGQRGWNISSGAAQIILGGAWTGSQSVSLVASSSAAQIELEFGPPSPNPVFVDFWTRPVAGAEVVTGTILDIDAGRVAFLKKTLSTGRFSVLEGDGIGGGVWRELPLDIPLDPDGAAQTWQRISVRLNYSTKKWDFFHGTTLLAYDIPFRVGSANYFSWFALKGHTAASVKFDAIYAGGDNPLFTDADRDGLDDNWEVAHGLPTNADSRNTDFDGDSVTALREYFLSTNPQIADTDEDGANDGEDPSPLDNNKAPDVSLTTPTDGSTQNAPGTITITAEVSDSDAGDTVTRVEFYQNGQKLSEVATAPFTYTWNTVPAGIYSFTAQAFDNRGGRKTSATTTTTISAPAGVLPIQLGLRLFLDAGSIGLVDGAPIASWLDQSGRTSHATQMALASQPVLVLNQLNGRPVVRFDGDNDWLNLPDLMNAAPVAAAGEVFMVSKASRNADDSTRHNGVWQMGSGYYAFYPDSSGNLQDEFGSTTARNTGAPAISLEAYNLYNVSSKEGEWINRLNGVVHHHAVSNTVGWSGGPSLGRNGYHLRGDIAEILIYDKVLTPAEREAVGRYLLRRYALPINPALVGHYVDSNFDGVSDALDIALGFDPYDLDTDNDGLENLVEARLSTNPFAADSDHDGVDDPVDYFPLDPLRSVSTVADPSDHTGPGVTLVLPTQATLN